MSCPCTPLISTGMLHGLWLFVFLAVAAKFLLPECQFYIYVYDK
jgi:hypothetical protein